MEWTAKKIYRGDFMKKLLNAYEDGNVKVAIFDDGTRIIDIPDGEKPNLEFPLSMDAKITNWCDQMCPMCHEMSNPEGKHGDVMNLKFIDSLDIAYKDNSLNAICMALYDLCASYSNFYNNIKILTETDNNKKQSYLNLSALVLKVVEIGAYILAFDIPEKM